MAKITRVARNSAYSASKPKLIAAKVNHTANKFDVTQKTTAKQLAINKIYNTQKKEVSSSTINKSKRPASNSTVNTPIYEVTRQSFIREATYACPANKRFRPFEARVSTKAEKTIINEELNKLNFKYYG